MTKGIAKLWASTELIKSVLCLPNDIKIIDAKIHNDTLYDYIEFVVSGDGLPTLDDTNGEIKLAEMVVHARYVSEPYKSELKIDGQANSFLEKRRLNILYFIADGPNEYNSSRWRVSSPYNAINKRNWGHNARIASTKKWMDQDEETKELCRWADLISIQRVGIDKSIPAIKYWRSQGKAVVIDYDDDYFRINKSNAAFKFWGEGMVDITVADGHKFQTPMNTHPIAQFIEGLKSCTAATMPSELLAKDARKYTNAFFIPNYPERLLYPQQNRKEFDPNRIVIGWGGSLSHIESFEHSGVVPALRNILGAMDNVYLLIVGDERVVKKLKELGVRGDRILFHPYVPYDRWYQTLQLYDIGIAPLAEEYDMRRSWIKVMEYMIMGIPFVATDTAPYENPRIRHNARTGMFIPQGDKASDANPVAWENALMGIIGKMPNIKKVAEEDSVEHYDNFLIDNNIKSVIKTYQEIVKLENIY